MNATATVGSCHRNILQTKAELVHKRHNSDKTVCSFSSNLNTMSNFDSSLNFFNNDFFLPCLFFRLLHYLSVCSPELSSCSRRNRPNLITGLFYSRRRGAIKGESTETGLGPSIRSLLAANADLTSGNAAALKLNNSSSTTSHSTSAISTEDERRGGVLTFILGLYIAEL